MRMRKILGITVLFIASLSADQIKVLPPVAQKVVEVIGMAVALGTSTKKEDIGASNKNVG